MFKITQFEVRRPGTAGDTWVVAAVGTNGVKSRHIEMYVDDIERFWKELSRTVRRNGGELTMQTLLDAKADPLAFGLRSETPPAELLF